MDPLVTGAIIAGGAGLIGGWLNSEAQSNAANSNDRINQRNAELQREFAQNGVRWKVADAHAAGIDPLVALGAQTHSFAPQSIGAAPDTSWGDSLSNMGQDVSRAVAAGKTTEERAVQALQVQGMKLDLEGKALDNQIRASQLNKLKSVGPAIPSNLPSGASGTLIPGQANAYVTKPAEITASSPDNLARQAGAGASYGLVRNDDNSFSVVPSKDVKEAIEDNLIQETLWSIRNQLLPAGKGLKAPPGMRWNPYKQAFEKGRDVYQHAYDAFTFDGYKKNKLRVPVNGRSY